MEVVRHVPSGEQGSKPRLAIICPVFNEERAIPLFFERMKPVTDALRDRYEPRLYFVDNGSIDSSQAIVRDLAATHAGVYLIVLSRNFGYQWALDCGLRVAVGDLYAMIDVDCEDPPELIPRFVAEHERGYDIVYGERLDRPEPAYLKWLRRSYYRLVRAVADDYFVMNMAEFSLITAEVRNAVIDETNSFPFIRSSIGRIGFRRKNIPYTRERRSAGETHYNLLSMTIFGIAGLMTASTVALRWPAYLFVPWLALLTALWGWAVVSPHAWQLATMLWISAAFVGFCCVVVALYVARIYKNTLGRPNAVVRLHLSLLPSNAVEQEAAARGVLPVDAWPQLRGAQSQTETQRSNAGR